MISRLSEARALLGRGADPAADPVEWIAALRWCVDRLDEAGAFYDWATTNPVHRGQASLEEGIAIMEELDERLRQLGLTLEKGVGG